VFNQKVLNNFPAGSKLYIFIQIINIENPALNLLKVQIPIHVKVMNPGQILNPLQKLNLWFQNMFHVMNRN
jgi:hypothetical protein